MTLALIGLTWFNWLLIAISTVVAAMVVDKLKCSNIKMIPIIAIVWLLCWIVVGVLQFTWALIKDDRTTAYRQGCWMPDV